MNKMETRWLQLLILAIISTLFLLQPQAEASRVRQHNAVSKEDALAFAGSIVKFASNVDVSSFHECETDLVHIVSKAEAAFTDMNATFKSHSETKLSSGLSDIVVMLTNLEAALHKCGFNGVANLLKVTLPSFQRDLVVGEKILAAGIDVTDDVQSAVAAAASNDWRNAGFFITKALIQVFSRENGPLESFLKHLLVVFQDMRQLNIEKCKTNAVQSWINLNDSIQELKDASESGKKEALVSALKDMDRSLNALSDGLNMCGVNGISKLITDTFKNADNDIEKKLIMANKVYIKGADVFNKIVKVANDLTIGHYTEFGKDLAELILFVNHSGKLRKVLSVAVQFLEALKDFDLDNCEMDFGEAGSSFHTAMVALQSDSDDLNSALQSLADSMDRINIGLDDCGINGAANVLDAAFGKKVLNFGPHTFEVDSANQIYLKGVNVTSEVKKAAEAWLDDNYLAVGQHFAKAVLDAGLAGKLAEWISAALRASSVFKDFDFEECRDDLSSFTSNLHYDFLMISSNRDDISRADVQAAMNELLTLLDELNNGLKKCGIVSGLELLSNWKSHGNVSVSAKVSLSGIDVTNSVVIAAQQWRDGRYALSALSLGKAVFKADPDLVDKAVEMFLRGLMDSLKDNVFKFDFGMCKNDMSQIWASVNSAYGSWKQRNTKECLESLVDALATLSDSLEDCGVRDIAKVVADATEQVIVM